MVKLLKILTLEEYQNAINSEGYDYGNAGTGDVSERLGRFMGWSCRLFAAHTAVLHAEFDSFLNVFFWNGN